ncbi:MAG: hypothetical protein AAGA55_05820 [Planctomycetota bacterium]
MADSVPVRPKTSRPHLLRAAGVLWLLLAGCADLGPLIPATDATSPVSGHAPDPTRSVYFSWGPIDRAIEEGAIGFGVVATRIDAADPERIPYERSFRLLAPRDRPGMLTIERGPDDGLFEPGTREILLTARIGRFGDPDLESAVIEAITRRLRALAVQTPD